MHSSCSRSMARLTLPSTNACKRSLPRQRPSLPSTVVQQTRAPERCVQSSRRSVLARLLAFSSGNGHHFHPTQQDIERVLTSHTILSCRLKQIWTGRGSRKKLQRRKFLGHSTQRNLHFPTGRWPRPTYSSASHNWRRLLLKLPRCP